MSIPVRISQSTANVRYRGLFDPTLVTIVTSDDDEDGDSDWVQTFNVPLDLISARSPYFKSMFEGGFAESESGKVRLNDVSPWVFRVFVGWLYYQQIFYEPERKRRRIFSRPDPTEAADNGTAGDSRTMALCTEQTTASPNDTTKKQGPPLEAGSIEAASARPFSEKTKNGSKRATSEAAKPNSALHQCKARHPPGGSANMIYQIEDTEAGDEKSDGEDDYDYHDPVTWPWIWLFELYLFADKYSVRDLRIAVFDVIQLKVLQREPRTYLLASISELTYVVDNLLPSSPLYRSLIDYQTFAPFGNTGDDAEEQGSFFEDLPGHFLARSYVAARRRTHAARCSKCRVNGTGEECAATDHKRFDRMGPKDKGTCFYHEHGADEEERAQCGLRWGAVLHKL